MCSCFMGVDLDVTATPQHIDNHKAYVQAWIQSIRGKPETLIRAIKDAEVPAMFFRKRDKVVLTLTPQEARYARSILLRWRNKLLNAGKPTEDVEELILRLAR